MAKPWEETWIADGKDIRIGSDARDGFVGKPCASDDATLAARARLAAAAPQLARALLAVEWSGETEHLDDLSRVYASCPRCSGFWPCDEAQALAASVRRFDVHVGHHDDCVLDAALRAAGVR